MSKFEPSTALLALQAALARVTPRADGNYNAGDFDWALAEAIKDCEQNEYESRMGDSL